MISGARAWNDVTRKTLSPDDVATPFKLTEDDRFFFFGSCLARQMERALRMRGLTVLSTSIALPANEGPVGADVVNKLTVTTILQELSWAFGTTTFPEGALIEESDGLWQDPQLTSGLHPVSRERALQRRRDIARYFARIADATVVVLDLCHIDVWYDTATGLALNDPPSYWGVQREPERFRYALYSYDDVRMDLLEVLRVLGQCGVPKRFILTANPMALEATFRGGDVQTAETLIKCTMRTVAGDLAAAHDYVAYYPTFESFNFAPYGEVFDLDRGYHVRTDTMDRVMESMLRAFGIERSATEPDYDEVAYLRANPDVAALVRCGDVESGYHHWIAEGRAAGRPLVAEEVRIDDPIAGADMHVTIAARIPERAFADEQIALRVDLANTGGATYATSGRHPVHFCYRWYDETGTPAEEGRSLHTSIPEALMPGESTTLTAAIATPQAPGRYWLALTLLQHCVAWFDDIDPANGLRSAVAISVRPRIGSPEPEPEPEAAVAVPTG
jgi:hypothetical protein